MRDDLLDAYAAIDWAKAQFPILQQMIKAWFDKSPYLLVEEPHPEMGQKLFKLQVNRRLSPTINAGVGAAINSVRTSLDLLCAAIAARNGKKASRDTRFPIYASVDEFFDPINVAKRKKWLSASDLRIIEDLKPYQGGNDLLFALHQLDITRKHERLISVHLIPSSVSVTPEAHVGGLHLPMVWPGFKDGAVIAWSRIDAPECDFQIGADIAFDEAEFFTNKPVIPTLGELAGFADSIIQRFE